MTQRRLRTVGCAAIYSALLCAFVLPVRPRYNWDLIPYLAVAAMLRGMSSLEAHRVAYEEVDGAIGLDAFPVGKDSAYQNSMRSDPVSFAANLPLYTVKPMYPALVAIVSKGGVDPVSAAIWVSRLAYFAFAALVFMWIRTFLGPALTLLVSLVIAGQSFALDLAMIATPDAMSTAFVVGALYLWVVKRRPSWAMALLTVAVLVRPDNLLWLLPVAMFSVRRRPLATVCFSTVAVLLAVLLVQVSGNYGWRALFAMSFLERGADPEFAGQVFTVGDALGVYIATGHPALLPVQLKLMAPALGFMVWFRWWLRGWDLWTAATAGAVFFVLAHWLLFPTDDRFFAPAYIVTVVGIAYSVRELWAYRRMAMQRCPGRAGGSEVAEGSP